MKFVSVLLAAVTIVEATATKLNRRDNDLELKPASGERNVNLDTQLAITFASPPTIGHNGTIRVYDAVNNQLVDFLNMSIPPSPSPYGNGSTKANYTDETTYQTNIIGGMDFYIYPIILRNNTTTNYLHNNKLSYGRKYYIEIDARVVDSRGGSFSGIEANDA